MFKRLPLGPLRDLAASSLMIIALIPATGAAAAPAAADATTPNSAVPHLDWRACGGGFFCATARVPLNYARPGGTKISIAVIKHPATGKARRIGSLFYNPGGPGGAGVAALRQDYSLFPPTVRARFDMVSFDPRGIGQSTVLKCFANIKQERRLLAPIASKGFPIGARQQRKWENTYARFDQACAAHAGPLLAHDSTADTARDMDLLRQAVGDATMNYYGLSYGTYLGATYANLFPSKVRAMVLDSNADPVQWATGTGGSAKVLDTFLRIRSDEGSAAALNAFLNLCGRAPSSTCAFSAGSPAATHAKFATLLNRLSRHPVTLSGDTFTKGFTVDVVVNALYRAVPGWADLATLLADLWTMTGGGPAPATIPPFASGVQPGSGIRYSGLESAIGVLCSDSPNPRNPREYATQSAIAQARSGVVGPDWVWPSEACARWPVLARDRYTGPFNRHTAPILVVNNKIDPATPYQSAVAMSRELASARLLTVDGYGHGVLLNPSNCAAAAEERYFVTGRLPRPGAVCHQNARPFAH